MQKILIYKGSKAGFSEFIEREQASNYKLFISEIYKIDELKQKTSLFVINVPQEQTEEDIERAKNKHKQLSEIDEQKSQNMVIFSENYSSLNEHVLSNIKLYFEKLNIKNVLIHNPPHFLEDLLVLEYKKLVKVEEENYSYFTLEKLQQLENDIKQKVLGQNNALENLLNYLTYTLQNSFKKPLVLLFYGSSGIGKTETAQCLARILGKPLFRKQMSMGQSGESLTYFFGGKHGEKSLAKDLLGRESNIILLDEFDKVNKTFHNAFYQLFDEGDLVDNNYSVKLGKSIIICTSNFSSEDQIKKELGEPIFSRFDDVIKYEDLTVDILKQIINKEIETEFENLDQDQKEKIDKNEITKRFSTLSDNKIKSLQNARKVKKYVRYIFAVELRKYFLDTHPAYKANS
jgi:ATP-dependent Clp protease ATP-binding subunit ClpA